MKTEGQFNQDNCDNCGNDVETTKKFSGMICMMEPSASWVAKWNKLSHLVPGCYAVDVKKYDDQEDDGGDFVDDYDN